jgi:regulator of protease activity HflC (stomatin/prohibitin superfamily)
MLLHHAACPGIDHDLQQVASQFLCVPAWKVMHAQAVAAHEQERKLEAKAEKARAKEEGKQQRIAEHQARNAALKAEHEARKAAKQVGHAALNAAAKATKATKKLKVPDEAQPSLFDRRLAFLPIQRS